MSINSVTYSSVERTIISDSILDLTGRGYEFLTDRDGNIIAQFVNGHMCVVQPSVSIETASLDTVTAA